METNPGLDPLANVLLAEQTNAALTLAATRRGHEPLNTFGILSALVAIDELGDWGWVQLATNWISPDEADLFTDPDAAPHGHWQGAPLTVTATTALATAANIAAAYDLRPLPPGVLALGLLWDPGTGASKALRNEAGDSHRQLLAVVQENVLGTTLIDLPVAMAQAHRPVEYRPAGDIRILIEDAASLASRTGTYRVIGTAAVLLAAIDHDPATWRRSADNAGVSFNEFYRRVAAAAERSTETLTQAESELDASIDGVRLTAELEDTLGAIDTCALALAGTETPSMSALLGPGLLTRDGTDASRTLEPSERSALAQELLGETLGARVPDFAQRINGSVAKPAPPHPVRRDPQRRATSIGFNLGTFVGAIIISGLGGTPFATALVIAFVVRFAANRVRKRDTPQRLLKISATAALVGAALLVLTTTTDLSDIQHARAELRLANADVASGKLAAAIPHAARAGLYENQSVRIAVLQACIDWQLGFVDYALLEAQQALDLGYRPDEESHYRGRGCFLDVPDIRGVNFLKTENGVPWLIYPQPYLGDTVGETYLDIAEAARHEYHGQEFVALGCLADRYDLRDLASFLLQVGVNVNLKTNGGPTPYAALRRCLKSPSIARRYTVTHDRRRDIDVIFPRDFYARLPTTRKPRPPANACWTHFPGPPCNR